MRRNRFLQLLLAAALDRAAGRVRGRRGALAAHRGRHAPRRARGPRRGPRRPGRRDLAAVEPDRVDRARPGRHRLGRGPAGHRFVPGEARPRARVRRADRVAAAALDRGRLGVLADPRRRAAQRDLDELVAPAERRHLAGAQPADARDAPRRHVPRRPGQPGRQDELDPLGRLVRGSRLRPGALRDALPRRDELRSDRPHDLRPARDGGHVRRHAVRRTFPRPPSTRPSRPTASPADCSRASPTCTPTAAASSTSTSRRTGAGRASRTTPTGSAATSRSSAWRSTAPSRA